ncbi:hypothetical protein EYF80_022833 [Liparis tanakae]|uniref:Uncharacterized protein n=1 Tax=Liparis tanakae TaxID=230148 RepID=A0A4Z2HM49_9TELE|nr:hypothetical protein EYF80_022833 [Liparis tanakae]
MADQSGGTTTTTILLGIAVQTGEVRVKNGFVERLKDTRPFVTIFVLAKMKSRRIDLAKQPSGNSYPRSPDHHETHDREP